MSAHHFVNTPTERSRKFSAFMDRMPKPLIAAVNVTRRWLKRCKVWLMTSDEVKQPNLERHLQSVIVVIIVGLLAWVGNTVQETQVAVAKLSVELQYLKQQMTDQNPAAKFDRVEKRLDAIEKTLGEHVNGQKHP